ncbi:hematopoietic progenitor cell antigen CD34 isoform 2-T2 [Hipposideros larvatus]
MLGCRGARAERGMPRSWTALCLLSLLPSAFTNVDNLTVTIGSSTTEIFSSFPTTESTLKMTTPSSLASTVSYPVSQDSNGTTTAISEHTVNITSTSEITSVPGTMNSSVQTQTSLTITVSSIPVNFSATETLKPSMSPGNVSDPLYNSTSLVTSPGIHSTSLSSTPSTIKGDIECSSMTGMKLTHGICLKLNKSSSCENFRKDNGEELIRILCGKDQAEAETRGCSLPFVLDDTMPLCPLLLLVNRTESTSMLQLLEKHQSDLRKLGIQDFIEQDVGGHQSNSRKTLIALVTSGILLAVLGIICYFLMNRRSWSPTGERLELEP